jgi:8-oxo-dGTP pyrophosphatase MutT (NUDIX family)
LKRGIFLENKSYIRYLREMVGDSMVILNAANTIIVNDKNEVLLQQRSEGGLWGLPGGLMELEDTIESCAIREAKEEMGIDVRLTDFVGIFVNPMMRWRKNDRAKVICYCFVAEIIGGSVAISDDESVAFGYFPKDSLPPIHAIDNLEAIHAYYANQRSIIEGKSYR